MPHRFLEQDWPPEKIAAARTIQRLMEFWQIEPHELHGAVAPPAPVRPAASAPKYRHPVSGETWDGVGSQPDWLRHALLKEGYLVEELRVPEDRPDAVQQANGQAAAQPPGTLADAPTDGLTDGLTDRPADRLMDGGDAPRSDARDPLAAAQPPAAPAAAVALQA